MDSHLYVDQYLRRKKGAAFPATSSQHASVATAAQQAILAAANLRQTAIPEPAMPQQTSSHTHAQQASSHHVEYQRQMDSTVQRALSEHATVVQNLATNVQAFVDRNDSLNLQVQTLEDKVMNLTKLVKMSQDINEDQVRALSGKLDETLRRLGEREDAEHRLRGEVQELRTSMHATVRESVGAAVEAVRADIERERTSSREALRGLESSHSASLNELMHTVQKQTESLVVARVAQEAERTAGLMNEVRAKVQADVATAAAGFKPGPSLDGQMEAVRRLIDERVATASTQLRESINNDVRHATTTLQGTLKEELRTANTRGESDMRDVNARLEAFERQSADVEASLQEFITAFRDHNAQQGTRMEETAASMRELMELHDETRSVVASEIEATKQWATRNMQRLKKHLDNVNADIAAIKSTQHDTIQTLETMRSSNSQEQQRLAELLSQRTKEAAALAQMVDREISSVRSITRNYRHTAGGRHTATEVTSSSTAAAGHHHHHAEQQQHQQGDTARSSDAEGDDDLFEAFADRTRQRRRQMHSLFDELAFKGRGGAAAAESEPRRH